MCGVALVTLLTLENKLKPVAELEEVVFVQFVDLKSAILGILTKLAFIKSKVKSNDSKFIEGFVSTSLVICVGAMAIVGSFQDGLLHDPSVLISKAVMDFVIVMVFASTLGVGTIFSAIPIFVYQGLLTVCASFLAPYFTTTMISNISFVGSVLIFAVGTNLCFHTKIKVGNLLPAVFMPLLLALFM